MPARIPIFHRIGVREKIRLHAVGRLGDAVPECVVVIGFCQGAGDTVGSGSGHAVLGVVRVTRDQYTALVL